MEYAARIGVGFARRLADIQAAERYEKQSAMDVAARTALDKLTGKACSFKSFPETIKFISLFDGEPRFRRPMLVIVSGANLGKSMLGADVLRQVGELLGVSGFLQITVEGNEHLDMADFDHRTYRLLPTPPTIVAILSRDHICHDYRDGRRLP